jgi:hypothetical protein
LKPVLLVHSFVSVLFSLFCYSNNPMPNGTSNCFLKKCNKATESDRVLGHLAGRGPSQLEPMLTLKVKPSFRLNFVGDILSYWSHAQLVFCFYISIKFLILGLFKGCKKATFGGLGEPPASSLTTENVRFRQQNGRFELQSNRRKGLDEKKESSCFSHEPCVKH